MKLGILSGFHTWEESYRKACEELNIDYVMVSIRSADWMGNIKNVIDDVDGFIASPPCSYQEFKTIYDERLFFIDQFFKKPIYPNFRSCYIYESKRNMAAFLEFYNIPHAKTKVFTKKSIAKDYLKRAVYPLVIKANIGAGGKAVDIVSSYCKARRIVNKSFGFYKGLFCTGNKPSLSKFGIPIKISGSGQRHFLIIQDFHKIKWEWRILKIGNSYFGHQKLLKGNKASGSGLVGWVMPPDEVLYLAKDICEKGGFDVMDVDIFETIDGKFLVNELQAQFGSYLDYQMMVDNQPGRLVYSEENGFVWEEGIFNKHNSCMLKVENFLEILSKK
ncbi:MAG: hypothetical protein ACLUPL_01435 [Butyricimonas virosa]